MWSSRLPREQGARRAQRLPPASMDTDRRGPVLIADDEEDILQLLQFVLEDAGLAVTPVPDGLEAVKAADGCFHPVAILDVVMPNMTGIEAGTRLRSSHPEMFILMHTSWDEEHVRSQFDGYDAFLRKPSSTTELVSRVESFLAAGHRH